MELDGLLQPLSHHAAQTLVRTLSHELKEEQEASVRQTIRKRGVGLFREREIRKSPDELTGFFFFFATSGDRLSTMPHIQRFVLQTGKKMGSVMMQ